MFYPARVESAAACSVLDSKRVIGRSSLVTGSAPYDRALPLASLVRTMRNHYLAVHCTCGAARVIAIGQMARDRRLADRTLAHVALRLSCDGCRTGPDEVWLTESIFGIGPAPSGAVSLGWSICLVERPKAGARHLRVMPEARKA